MSTRILPPEPEIFRAIKRASIGIADMLADSR